ncbi:hypothetical protein [Amycolatopsis rubida]|nr:hypothetical protein [Amycolatopsis rubida]MYW96073.1 hypothetical protein [Amycolatopsis rubida]
MWWGEWVAILLGGGGGCWIALGASDKAKDVVAIGAALAGVVIGGVIAGMAIQAAGLDTEFLRKLNKLGIATERYLTPFLSTTLIGVLAVAMLIVWGAMAQIQPAWIAGIAGTTAGGLALWSLASLIPALGTLVQFVGLRQESIGRLKDSDS